MVAPMQPRDCEPSHGVAAATQNLMDALRRYERLEIHELRLVPAGASNIATPSEEVVAQPGVRGYSRTLNQARKVINSYQVDLIHIQGVASLAIGNGKRLLTIHGRAEKDAYLNHTDWTRVPRAAILALSEGLPRLACPNAIELQTNSRRNIVGRRRWGIPNALHEMYYQKLNRKRQPLISNVGAISPLKNTALTIRMFAEVSRLDSSAQLAVVGPGVDSEYGKYCRKLARDLQVHRHVHFTGTLGRPDVIALLDQTRLVLHPSRQENAPMALIEALSRGCRVAASPLGSIPTMLTAPETTTQLEPSSILDLYSKAWAPGLAQIRAQSVAHHHPAQVAAQTVKVYHELA